jgi:predicted kinase
MTQPVILLCGVPASGKTWVIERLHHKYHHIMHDMNSRQYLLKKAVEASEREKPVIIDCPFDERALRAQLEDLGLTVQPVFIVETPEVIAQRYQKRNGKPAPKNVITRAETIMNKVEEWQAHYGTSDEILKYLMI